MNDDLLLHARILRVVLPVSETPGLPEGQRRVEWRVLGEGDVLVDLFTALVGRGVRAIDISDDCHEAAWGLKRLGLVDEQGAWDWAWAQEAHLFGL